VDKVNQRGFDETVYGSFFRNVAQKVTFS